MEGREGRIVVTNRYKKLREQHCADYDRLFPLLLEQTRWSEGRLHNEREMRLRELLHVAKERSPWHARRLASVSPASFDFEDLPHVPAMTKQDLMENFDMICTDPQITLAVASDEIMLLEEPCACGSGHRRIASVYGRQDDLFHYGEITIHPLVFRSPLGREANVIEYCVTQTRSGAQIALCTRGPVDLERLGRIVRQGLADAGLTAPDVRIHIVTALDRQDTGKLKRFVPLPEG